MDGARCVTERSWWVHAVTGDAPALYLSLNMDSIALAASLGCRAAYYTRGDRGPSMPLSRDRPGVSRPRTWRRSNVLGPWLRSEPPMRLAWSWAQHWRLGWPDTVWARRCMLLQYFPCWPSASCGATAAPQRATRRVIIRSARLGGCTAAHADDRGLCRDVQRCNSARLQRVSLPSIVWVKPGPARARCRNGVDAGWYWVNCRTTGGASVALGATTAASVSALSRPRPLASCAVALATTQWMLLRAAFVAAAGMGWVFPVLHWPPTLCRHMNKVPLLVLLVQPKAWASCWGH